MQRLVASPVAALESPAWGVALTRDELDSTVGGFNPIGFAVLAFTVSVVIGALDRLFFGGCHCR